MLITVECIIDSLLISRYKCRSCVKHPRSICYKTVTKMTELLNVNLVTCGFTWGWCNGTSIDEYELRKTNVTSL